VSEEEQGLSLGQLIVEVEHAAHGNLTQGTYLARITERLSQDAQSPEDVRSLAKILRRILAGERNPEMSALPGPFAEIIQGMIQDLMEDERNRRPEDGNPNQDEEGLTLEEFLSMVETAAKGDQRLGAQLFSLTQQMSRDTSLEASLRELAQVLSLVLAGDHNPAISNLSSQLREPVSQMLQRINADH
jgi:hypothetical protein